jgi:hypothetical protein
MGSESANPTESDEKRATYWELNAELNAELKTRRSDLRTLKATWSGLSGKEDTAKEVKDTYLGKFTNAKRIIESMEGWATWMVENRQTPKAVGLW